LKALIHCFTVAVAGKREQDRANSSRGEDAKPTGLSIAETAGLPQARAFALTWWRRGMRKRTHAVGVGGLSWLVVLAACGAAFVVAVAVASPAEAVRRSTVEAEHMSGAGKIIQSKTASKHKARLFEREGSARIKVQGRAHEIAVRVKGNK